ncbi:hypothetical protein D3C87_1829440 [compost metagenome]
MNTGASVLRLPPLDGEGLRVGWPAHSRGRFHPARFDHFTSGVNAKSVSKGKLGRGVCFRSVRSTNWSTTPGDSAMMPGLAMGPSSGER